MNQKTRDILFMVSSILVIIGAALPLFIYPMQPWVPYIFAVGAAGVAVCRLTHRYKGKNFRIKRLHHIAVFSALFLLVSSYLMFAGDRNWIMFLMIAALLQLYTSVIIPREEKKEEEQKAQGKR